MYHPFSRPLAAAYLSLALIFTLPAHSQAQSNVTVRIMAANLTSGNNQSYETEGINIFKGLNPDIVAIQEFRYNSSSSSNSLRTLVNTAFGTDYSFHVESGSYNIPNGIISRWPILASGSWDDPDLSDRGFAWARIDLPGTNDLYVVSVHLWSGGSASDRGNEANLVKAHIQTNFPTGAWVIVGGDFNTDNRTEAAVDNFKTILSDSPIPTDKISGGDPDTNEPRNKPYDYVMPSFSLTNYQIPVVIGPNTFPNGLVFDSQVYAATYTLTNVAPIQSGDSHVSNMQHMAVIKDFSIPGSGSNAPVAPIINTQPQSQTVAVSGTASFNVSATGTAPLAYQWRFNGTNISGALTNTYTLANAQTTNNGGYTVVITNTAGAVTSSIATLTVSNVAPTITTNPASLAVFTGETVAFSATAAGTAPLAYQWRFNGTNIAGATNDDYSFNNAQTNNAGNYTVVVNNNAGSITSAVAVLTVNPASTSLFSGTLAGWDVSGQTAYGTSPLSPSTNAANITVTGLTRGSGVGTSGTAAGRAWGGNDFNAASATVAISSNDFATCSIAANTGYKVSFSSISRFDYRRSSTGPPNGVLQYQVGSGVFTSIITNAYTSTASSGSSLAATDLSGISALQDVGAGTNVTFRIVNFGGTQATGTWYIFDVSNNTNPDFAIDGTIASTAASPAVAADISTLVYSGGQFHFTATGSTSSNYIVQGCSDLTATNWIPLATNASPFTYTDAAANSFTQRFYRVILKP